MNTSIVSIVNDDTYLIYKRNNHTTWDAELKYHHY